MRLVALAVAGGLSGFLIHRLGGLPTMLGYIGGLAVGIIIWSLAAD